MIVPQSIALKMEEISRAYAMQVLNACALKYNFDAKDAMLELGLENIPVTKTGKTKEKKEKKVCVNNVSVVSIPVPFVKGFNYTGCQGLCYNHGLFTPCSKSTSDNKSMYCVECETDGFKNENGMPTCGNVERRSKMELMEYTDLSGRKVVHYLKVMKKLKMSVETALKHAEIKGLTIQAEHLSMVQTTKRGRPKKPSQVVESAQVEDLFARLLLEETKQLTLEDLQTDSNDDEEPEPVVEEPEPLAEPTKVNNDEPKAKKNDEAKTLEKEAKAAAKAQEKDAKAAAKAQEKDAKAAAKAQEKEKEKESKAAAKPQEKDAKAAEKPATKESKKVQKKEKPATEEKKVEEEEKPVKISVKKITYQGTTYLHNPVNNMVYNMEKAYVGTWVAATSTLAFDAEE